jgi:hypothetical protein
LHYRLWLALGLILPGLGAGLWWALRAPSQAPDDGPAWFADATERVGLHFVHDPGPLGKYFMPQIFGSGAALFDFDGDGRLDLYLLTNGGPKSDSINRLYKSLPDGSFKDVTDGSGLGIAGHNMGVAIGDVNNDGRPDVLVTQYGGVKLFLNLGGGKFQDITDAAGLANPAWGTSAAFFDYDRDGWLDLVIVNYVDYDPTWVCKDPGGKPDYCTPQAFPYSVSRLFHNRGSAKDEAVRFEDVTVQSGLGKYVGPGLGVLCADFDGDGLADLFVTHLRNETNTLWRQGPRGLFADRTGEAGLLRPLWQGTGFGTVLGDFDLDGHLDLAIVNGHVVRTGATPAQELGPYWGAYGDRNQLFANDGHGRFTDISPRNPPFCGRWNVARGLAAGDFDGDGKLDLLVTTIGAKARLYRNVAPTTGHWLAVRARLPSPRDRADRTKDRDALGAEVVVEAGARRWVRLIHAASSYLSSSDPCAHFGLGETAQVDRITVLWPDGSREQFDGTRADRMVELRQGQGRPIERGGR